MMLALCSACTKPDPIVAEPKTFDDCILQKVTAGQSAAATRAITEACERKFNPPRNDMVEYRSDPSGTIVRYRNGKMDKVVGKYEPAPSKAEFVESN